ACAPIPVANKTRTTTAQTSRFIRLSPLTVRGAVLSHTALNLVIHVVGELSSPCGNAWSLSSIPVGRRGSRPRTHTAPYPVATRSQGRIAWRPQQGAPAGPH